MAKKVRRRSRGWASAARQREYQRAWKAKRRMAWLIEHGPCKHCGSWEDLEVDHVDKELKSLPIENVWSMRAEVRRIELAKCQVLCRPCHLEKGLDEGDYHYGEQWERFK